MSKRTINWLLYILILVGLLSACNVDTETAVQQTIAARDALAVQVEQTVAAQVGAANSAGTAAQDIGVSVEQTIAARDASESNTAALAAESDGSETQVAAQAATAVAATQIAGSNASGNGTAEQVTVDVVIALPLLRVNLASVNVRNGPGTAYRIISGLSEGDTVVALAKNSNGSWYNIELPGGSTGWIADSVTDPVAASAMDRVAVAATIPPLPTSTAPPTATSTPIPTATSMPIAPTPVPTVVSQPPTDGLNPSLGPNYGSVSLSAGFTPDPYEVSLLSGGDVDVANLGIGFGCAGYATSAPDFRLFWSGEGSELNFLFRANSSSDDTTLIINNPYGSWSCNDDLDGWNPGIRFGSAPSGQYDFWIGSYSSGANVSGQLIITEFAIP